MIFEDHPFELQLPSACVSTETTAKLTKAIGRKPKHRQIGLVEAISSIFIEQGSRQNSRGIVWGKIANEVSLPMGCTRHVVASSGTSCMHARQHVGVVRQVSATVQVATVITIAISYRDLFRQRQQDTNVPNLKFLGRTSTLKGRPNSPTIDCLPLDIGGDPGEYSNRTRGISSCKDSGLQHPGRSLSPQVSEETQP